MDSPAFSPRACGKSVKMRILPSLCGGRSLKSRKAQVTVLKTPDQWYGVTYKADKEAVVKAMADKKAAGVYPEKLWEE